MKATFKLNNPKLRDEVKLHIDKNISLIYGDQSCDLDVEQAKLHDVKKLLIKLADGVSSLDSLEKEYPELNGQVAAIIHELDRNGLITESSFPVDKRCLTGKQLYRELSRLFTSFKTQNAQSEFY